MGLSLGTGTLRYTLPEDEVGNLATCTVETGSAESGYEATYANDFTQEHMGRPARSASSAAFAIQIDFGSAVTLAAMLLWHSTDAGGVITVEGNSSPDWDGSPATPFSTTVTALAKRGDRRTHKLWVAINQTYRYWRISLPSNATIKPGIKFQAYSELQSFIGYSASGQHFKWGMRILNSQYGIDHPTAFAGVHWHYDKESGTEAYTGPLDFADADVDRIQYLHQATGGRAPILFIPDVDEDKAWLARLALGPAPNSQQSGDFVSLLDIQVAGPDYNTVTLTVEEVTAGGPEWA